jgi:hypothetical protein
MDSKGTMWIFGGSRDGQLQENSYLNALWNYDPIQDKYRWVAGNATVGSQFSNFGEMGVPGNDVFPGYNGYSSHAIDYNDNIWIYGSENENRFWMFNTTSLQFTWIGGDESNESPIYGDLGVASANYWPGRLEGACMVVDSKNNLWLLGGYRDAFARNAVWHYNTTSHMWSLQHGDPLSSWQMTEYENNFWPGRRTPGCTIDEEDRVWLFGGFVGEVMNDMWSFDTKAVELRVERGLNATYKAGSIVSFDTFDIDNYPAGRDRALMVDRRDGTIMMFGGNAGYKMSFGDIWVFDKTTKLWKIVYGNGNNGTIIDNTYGEYRELGSKLGSRAGYAIEHGLTSRGNLIIFGGENWVYFPNDVTHALFNDLWIVPREQCESNLHNCDPNANCTMGTWTHQCTCNEGYTGDGLTCTPVGAPSSSQSPSNQPSSNQSPSISPSKTPSAVTSDAVALVPIFLITIISLAW